MTETKATGSERIAAMLRDRIFSGEFAPGAPLREAELSAEYQVSRHVIREVLRSLVADGMAEYSSFKGVRVPLFTSDDIADIYRARRFLECGALAANGARASLQGLANIHGSFTSAVSECDWEQAFVCDVQFHSSIVTLSGSARLVEWHRELMQSLKLVHLVVPDFQVDGLIRSVPQHAEVIIALAAADTGRATHALERHLNDSECLLIQGMGSPHSHNDAER